MVTFAGTIIEGWEAVALGNVSASFPGEHPSVQVEMSPVMAEGIAGGSLTRNRVDIRQRDYDGTFVTTFFNDYYNRIHVFPVVLDFGAIVGTTTQNFYVWNAYLSEKEITSLTADGLEGAELVGPSSGKVFAGLEIVSYQLIAYTDGPPFLNALIIFDFEGESYSVVARGARARLWPLPPTWDKPYRISYEFRTDIITSRSGREQRMAQRERPRKSIEFTAIAHGAKLRELNRLMDEWHDKTFVFPDLPRFVDTSAGVAAGTTAVEVAAVPDWLVADAVVVMQSGSTSELRTVESIDGTTVNFVEVTGVGWPAGSRIYASDSGNLDVTISARRHTNDLAEVGVRMVVRPGTGVAESEGEADLVFDGREVFLRRPNWAQSVDVGFEHPVEVVDFGRGPIGRFMPIDFGTRTTRGTYLGKNFENAEAMRKFFFRMKGRRGEFYAPTWENDLPLQDTANAGTKNLRIVGPEVAQAYADDTVHRAVAVVMNDGTVHLNKVQSIFEDTVEGVASSVIQCAEEWEAEIAPENVKMISWLLVWRFAGDGVTFEWLTNAVANTQLSFQTLENLEND